MEADRNKSSTLSMLFHKSAIIVYILLNPQEQKSSGDIKIPILIYEKADSYFSVTVKSLKM